MTTTSTTSSAVSPWRAELEIVSASSHTGAERRSLSRDVERGLRRRLGPGAYVLAAEFDALSAEAKHVVRMRGASAASPAPIVFSHWSAAVLHGLPVDRRRLGLLHVTIGGEGERHRVGLAQHAFALRETETVRFADVIATSAGRTVVDVAGASPFDEGVMAADAALRSGIARAVLTAAVDLAGPRRASRRIDDAVLFAHPGAESPAESRTRVTAYRLGSEVPELQRPFAVRAGQAFADTWFPHADAVLEVDGIGKYLDPRLAPRGAGVVVLAEKQREDDIRAQVHAFARIGWAQSGSTALLRPVLARIGVPLARPRVPLSAWAAAAAAAAPR